MRKTKLLLFTLLFASVASAQQVRPPINAIIGWSHAAQQQDYLMGFDVGLTTNDKLLYFLSFDFRPYGRKVQEFAGNNLFYQYLEERYIITLGGRYLFELKDSGKGIFLGASGGYNFGEYRGLNLKPDQGWIIRPNAGMFWELYPDFFTLKLGYEYFSSRSDTVDDHWVFLTLLFKLKRNDY